MLRSGPKLKVVLGGIAFFHVFSVFGTCFADEAKSGQPYTEQIKNELESKNPTSTGSYTEEIKQKLEREGQGASPNPSEPSYIEMIQEQNPGLRPPSSESSYLDGEKAKLKPKSELGAIQAVNEGGSELHLKKTGEISQAFGFRYGVAPLSRVYTVPGSSHSVDFNALFGRNYAPEISFLYEYQLFHSESFGSLGLAGLFGVGVFSGTGQLSMPLRDPRVPVLNFPTQSQTTFQLFSFPATVALSYRFSLFHYLRPYIMAGPTAVGLWQVRSDSQPSETAVSYSAYLSSGVAILLDWMSTAANWNFFSEHGIHHSYLTLDYIQLIPVGGKVRVQSSGVFVGFVFEY
jgi:hypothetical protein